MYMLQCEDASNLSYCRKDSMMYINQHDGNYGTCQEKNKCITGNVPPPLKFPGPLIPPPLIPSVEQGGMDIIWIHTTSSTIHIKNASLSV